MYHNIHDTWVLYLIKVPNVVNYFHAKIFSLLFSLICFSQTFLDLVTIKINFWKHELFYVQIRITNQDYNWRHEIKEMQSVKSFIILTVLLSHTWICSHSTLCLNYFFNINCIKGGSIINVNIRIHKINTSLSLSKSHQDHKQFASFHWRLQ